MAQERTLGIAGAYDRESDDPSKAELQRRMEEARESISTTVTEIKETVAHQVENVKDALDWREHFKRQPVAWSLGAMGVGLMTGYCIAAAVKGDSKDDYSSSRAYSYTSQDVRDRLYPESSVAVQHASQSIGGNGERQHDGPGLLERFKETSAYDRLSKEVGTLGDRLVDELSATAQTVVLPALLAKLKGWIGLDLSTQRQNSTRPTTQNTQQRTNPPAYEPVLDIPS